MPSSNLDRATRPEPVQGEIDTGLAIDRPTPGIIAYRMGQAFGKGLASGILPRHEIPIEGEWRDVTPEPSVKAIPDAIIEP